MDPTPPPQNDVKVLAIDYNSLVQKCKRLVLWENVKMSGAIFGGLLTVEIVLMSMSFLSIVGYSGLLLLSALFAYRAYLRMTGQQDTLGILEKLDHKVELTSDEAEKMAKSLVKKTDSAIEILRNLFLMENLGNTIKFALALYVLTYIGARFNFLTLCLLVTIGVFVCPKVYELKKDEIDKLWDVALQKVHALYEIAKERVSKLPVPGLKDKAKQQ